MKKRLWLLVMLSFAGCNLPTSGREPIPPNPIPPNPDKTVPLHGQMAAFSGEQELQGFLVLSQEAQKGSFSAEGAAASGAEAPTSADAGQNQQITNNQEEGVDEGGLVKNYKDYLIVLRHGRLASAKVDTGTLIRIDEVAVKAEGLSDDVWYDELLIEEDRLVVIGYRYDAIPDRSFSRAATELNFFKISEAGQLSREETYFLESDDYYSWDNYAGRVIGKKLILSMPYSTGFLLNKQHLLHLPQIYRYEGKSVLTPLGNLFKVSDVIKPLRDAPWPTFHTILSCDLSAPGLDCQGKTIIDSWSRTLYVSPTTAYLWVEPYFYSYNFQEKRSEGSILYALSLDGSTSGAVRIQGALLNQFSMSEGKEGLDLFGFSSGRCQSFLVHLPSDQWGDRADPVSDGAYLCVNGTPAANRFSPTHLIAYQDDGHLVFINRNSGAVTSVEAPSMIRRLELAGERAVAVGTNDAGEMVLSSLALGEAPAVEDSDPVLLQEGEWRSHGYAFDEKSSTFGLATANFDGDSWRGIPSVSFFKIDPSGKISDAGKIEQREFAKPNENCTTSCIDWYGNSRPIFLGDQVLGLIGGQLSNSVMDLELFPSEEGPIIGL